MWGRLTILALLLSQALAQSSDDIQSPRIERLRVEVPSNPAASEQFWGEVRDQGGPLIESVPEDPASVLVTFLLRGGADLRHPIVFANVLWNNEPLKQHLVHLSGTDVWYRTYRFRPARPSHPVRVVSGWS